MVSAAEQLAANLNFSALAKAEELKKRIWFTLGALLVYRFGTYIPLPASTLRPGTRSSVLRRAASSACSTCFPAAASTDGDLCAQHHAVHLRLDHHSVDDHGVANTRAAQEGG